MLQKKFVFSRNRFFYFTLTSVIWRSNYCCTFSFYFMYLLINRHNKYKVPFRANPLIKCSSLYGYVFDGICYLIPLRSTLLPVLLSSCVSRIYHSFYWPLVCNEELKIYFSKEKRKISLKGKMFLLISKYHCLYGLMITYNDSVSALTTWSPGFDSRVAQLKCVFQFSVKTTLRGVWIRVLLTIGLLRIVL